MTKILRVNGREFSFDSACILEWDYHEWFVGDGTWVVLQEEEGQDPYCYMYNEDEIGEPLPVLLVPFEIVSEAGESIFKNDMEPVMSWI